MKKPCSERWNDSPKDTQLPGLPNVHGTPLLCPLSSSLPFSDLSAPTFPSFSISPVHRRPVPVATCQNSAYPSRRSWNAILFRPSQVVVSKCLSPLQSGITHQGTLITCSSTTRGWGTLFQRGDPQTVQGMMQTYHKWWQARGTACFLGDTATKQGLAPPNKLLPLPTLASCQVSEEGEVPG